MAKRTTRTNAETLDNIRKQAEERGREAGRQDLAVELMRGIGPFDAENMNATKSWLDGFAIGLNLAGGGDVAMAPAQMAVAIGRLEGLIRKITEEANAAPF